MESYNIIVREYLESLKEDKELDYLFPILLNIMGFRIVSTAKESKGQPQYGKDIIAIGKDESGVEHRFYFELKGHDAKDISDNNLFVRDGVMESILASKYTAFNDSSIPQFNSLPIKIVFVHNGILKSNTRPTFEGFINQHFKDGEFERWDIYNLTDLFSKYLFSEYLFTDDESLRLFKRTLVLLDAPDYDFSDFKSLVDTQIEKITKIKGRAFKKFFATLQLLSVIVLHYSRENNNLYPARECITYLILRVWRWILNEKLETKAGVIEAYRKLLGIHFNIIEEYFNKTLGIAQTENGLYAEQVGPSEEIGYPLRCFDYLNYLIYYFQAKHYSPDFRKELSGEENVALRAAQKAILYKILENNDGCARPLIDNHSISILNTFLFVLTDPNLEQDEINLIGGEYLQELLNNIIIVKKLRDRFPELRSNTMVLVEYASTNVRPHNYEDRSSLLLTILFELAAFLGSDEVYKSFQPQVKGMINLQTAYPNFEEYNIEELLFERHFDDEYYIESSIDLKDELTDFRANIEAKPITVPEYRTDKAGFPFLRTLAHIYYENELFPDEWRKIFIPEASDIL